MSTHDRFSLDLNDYRVEPKEDERQEQKGGIDLTDIGPKQVTMLVETKIPIDWKTRCMAVGCEDAADVQYHIQIEAPGSQFNLFMALDLCQADEWVLSMVLVP